MDYFGKEEGTELWNRLTVHYTPIHGGWLNRAEIFARQCLAIPRREAEAWNAKANPTRNRFTRSHTRIVE